MNFSKKNIIYILLMIIIVYFLSSYQLPYYIQRPGGADPLNPIVEVDGGYESEGEMYLVTVSGLQATPLQFLFAKILPHNEILPIDLVFPDGISQKEYMDAQLKVMESSQEAATVVAYEAAGADINIEYNGVYVVSVIEGMPAYGILEKGDRIVKIDNESVREANDLIQYVETKEEDDNVTIEFIRNNKKMERDIQLEPFEYLENKVGIGIQLVTDRNVTVDPPVEFSSGSIGGPSAGLMFSLEIYDQLTEEDLTKGYEIAGTGEIDYDGNVHRIGGIDKKVVAADKRGIDIFFVPNEKGKEDSNYNEALKTAEKIGTDMEIVPVDTFYDALEYLENLEK